MSKIYFERYTNIYRFMETIQARPNNEKFGKASRERGDWSGTNTWEEAQHQFANGIPEKAARLKKSLDAFKAKSNVNQVKRRPVNYYYGYTPNIPAAIIGLPKSMRRVETTPQKVKALSIIYDMGQNSATSAETLEKAGETMLQLVYMLECRGYRVSLDLLPFCAGDSREFLLSINLKDWRQHLDIMKLSFPLTSPAMFRRFGFAWAETLPGVTGGRVSGYGFHFTKSQAINVLDKSGVDTKNAHFVNVEDCTNAEFDALTMARNLGII